MEYVLHVYIHINFVFIFYAFCFLDVGPASVMVGNLVQGNRLAMAQGRDIGLMDDDDMARRVSKIFLEKYLMYILCTLCHFLHNAMEQKMK